jgi:hypothetical protein
MFYRINKSKIQTIIIYLYTHDKKWKFRFATIHIALSFITFVVLLQRGHHRILTFLVSLQRYIVYGSNNAYNRFRAP